MSTPASSLRWIPLVLLPIVLVGVLDCPLCSNGDQRADRRAAAHSAERAATQAPFDGRSRSTTDSAATANAAVVAIREAANQVALGASGSTRDRDTALMAALRQADSPERLQSILARAPVGSAAGINEAGENVLHVVLRHAHFDADVAMQLVAEGVPVHHADRQRVTPLMLAAGNGPSSLVQAMLDRGAPIDSTDNDGGTALIFAVLSHRTDNVRLLLERGANPRITQRDGSTALSLAAQQGFGDVERELRERLER
jgi:ankyrin repeat protein